MIKQRKMKNYWIGSLVNEQDIEILRECAKDLGKEKDKELAEQEKPKFRIDSRRLLDWINQIAMIHTSITKGKMFAAGFELCFLQKCMVECFQDLEGQEKE